MIKSNLMLHVCLHNTSIKDKKSQISYLNWLRPLLPPQTSKTTAKKEQFTENVELQLEQLKLISDDEEAALVDRDKDEITEEKIDTLTESNLGH